MRTDLKFIKFINIIFFMWKVKFIRVIIYLIKLKELSHAYEKVYYFKCGFQD